MTNKNQTISGKHPVFGYLIACIISILSIAQSFADPPNLTAVKKSIITYQESGEYRKEITNIVQQAKTYLHQRFEQNRQAKTPEKLAIVLDIDETALSNFNFLRKNNFCFNKEQFWQHIKAGDDSAIVPTLNLYRHAKQFNIAVFFITARPEKFRIPTERNLTSAGYYHWDGVYMRPNDLKKKSKSAFKQEIRKKITDMGYTIVVNVGDKNGDLSGGYAEKVYKLPNPFY